MAPRNSIAAGTLPSWAERLAPLNARIQSLPRPLDRKSFGPLDRSNNPISCLARFLLPLKGQKPQIQHTRDAGRPVWRLW